jgi:hypothetical protein
LADIVTGTRGSRDESVAGVTKEASPGGGWLPDAGWPYSNKAHGSQNGPSGATGR